VKKGNPVKPSDDAPLQRPGFVLSFFLLLCITRPHRRAPGAVQTTDAGEGLDLSGLPPTEFTLTEVQPDLLSSVSFCGCFYYYFGT